MRIAILSDIHGNLEALRAVLADIDRLGVERILCLGDNIGYGPEPEAVVALVRERQIPCVMGNHELALSDAASFERMNAVARQSLVINRRMMSAAALDFCRALPTVLKEEGARLVHGTPPDRIGRYCIDSDPEAIARLFESFAEPLCFVGHTHVPALTVQRTARAEKLPPPNGVHRLAADGRAIVNVGSVGQPRDGNNRSRYVLWDPGAATIEYRQVAYDIAATVERILACGLPAYNADRLW